MDASNLETTGARDDHSLVAACRAGHKEAFGILVRRYQDRLYPTIVRLIGCPEDAEDVVQDAFVRAFEKLDQFHGESSFYTWIYRIAINLALSGRRSRKHHIAKTLNMDERGDSGHIRADHSPDNDPVAVMERHERETLVEAALAKLGPEHRAVVILKDFDGCRYEEISELLNIPIGTVRSRLHRARSELRELLKDILGPSQSGDRHYNEAHKAVDA